MNRLLFADWSVSRVWRALIFTKEAFKKGPELREGTLAPLGNTVLTAKTRLKANIGHSFD